jgi:UDP-glucose 4-epimerase
MGLKYKSDNLRFIIGDIRDQNRVENSLIRENPSIIVIAAALKHIDKCETAVNECIQTNLMGPLNILNAIEKHISVLNNLEAVVFVSTDKACSSVNAYGAAKFIAEKAMIERSFYMKNIKFVVVRYGNVLNSNGSIIPILHEKGKDELVNEFTLTHDDMTRFVMTLDQSVDLIEHAILYAESGDTVIPKLVSLNVKDLFEIFSEIYNKPIKILNQIRPGEKLLESLINETQSMSMIRGSVELGEYTYIKPFYKNIMIPEQSLDYNSKINPMSKPELRQYLLNLKLI